MSTDAVCKEHLQHLLEFHSTQQVSGMEEKTKVWQGCGVTKLERRHSQIASAPNPVGFEVAEEEWEVSVEWVQSFSLAR